MCEANIAGSFAKASRLLKTLADLPVSAKQAQLVTERVGARLAEERERRTAAFLDLDAPEPAESPALLIISADGGRIQTRQSDPSLKWKEDKVGAVWEASPCPEVCAKEYGGPAPLRRSVTATLSGWNDLGDHLSELAHRRGYPNASAKLFLSDGAIGLRSLRERCFPDATFILDWAHAVQHLCACSRAVFGQTPAADRWYERSKARLWEGRVDLVLARIGQLARRLGPPPAGTDETDPRRVVANTLQYVRDNAAGMKYAEYRRRGWPIGSGVIESAIKQLGMRVKGSEKHWSMRGAEETLQVACALLAEDGTWEHFWRQGHLAA